MFTINVFVVGLARCLQVCLLMKKIIGCDCDCDCDYVFVKPISNFSNFAKKDR